MECSVPRIAAIGGGTGVPVLLRGLTDCVRSGSGPLCISAIACVSDNGGSSGALRQAFGMPGIGDLRNCLVALSDPDCLFAGLFQHRFDGCDGLQGHPLGNLIVTALHQKTGSLCDTVKLLGQILPLNGQVLPVTESETTLCARFENGETVRGEAQIRGMNSRIERVWLEPDAVLPASNVLETIAQADTIVMGPGSLYSSVISNLVVPGVAAAIRNSRALKVFIANLMTEPGETDGFNASDHLKAIERYVGRRCVDVCVLSTAPVDETAADRYRQRGAVPVFGDADEIAAMGTVPVSADLLDAGQSKVRHNPERLAHLIVSLTRGAMRARLKGSPALSAA